MKKNIVFVATGSQNTAVFAEQIAKLKKGSSEELRGVTFKSAVINPIGKSLDVKNVNHTLVHYAKHQGVCPYDAPVVIDQSMADEALMIYALDTATAELVQKTFRLRDDKVQCLCGDIGRHSEIVSAPVRLTAQFDDVLKCVGQTWDEIKENVFILA